MNDKNYLIALIADMLQRASYREVRFICNILRAMLGEEETAE